MFALIHKESNAIIRLSTEGVILADEKPYVWIQCPDDVTTAWAFDGTTFTPPPGPTLEEVKLAKRAAINAHRDANEAEGFYFNGVKFDSDQRSANRITFAALAAQAALAAGQPFSLDWTAADNSVVTLDAREVLGMAVALAQAGAANFYAAKALKQLVEAAGTPEEVAAVPLP